MPVNKPFGIDALDKAFQAYNRSPGCKPAYDVLEAAVHDEIDRLRAEASEGRAKAPREWRPINTAPQDGEEVDLWCASRGISTGPARVPSCWFSSGKWWRYDEQGDDMCRSEVANATHWMPIPKPPALADKEPTT